MTAPVQARAASPDSAPAAKRVKTGSPSLANVEAAALPFHSTLLDPANIQRLHQEHESSAPYKHAIINQLFEPEFLKKARQEIVEQISFREKETDIYRINQTGDLTNLSGLPESELALLPTLLSLRDALYSQTFRSFLQSVTGCGPLSGIKTDMSCAEYSEGCYLLNHDDVIGTRRISFILYLVLDEPAWQPEWGGALELYPVLEADDSNPDRPNVPHAKPTKSIPPAFNQFAFFEVQPGHSFHSVEEVVVQGDGEKGGVGARVSLSGWFHKPIEGEPGFEGTEGYAAKSSLQQLYATTLEPPTLYPSIDLNMPLPLIPSAEDLKVLSPYINPQYFSASILSQLRPQFIETSQLLLGSFLLPSIANELEGLIREADAEAEKGRRNQVIPKGERTVNLVTPQDAGEGKGWEIVGPPHIQRFCALSSTTSASSRLATLLNTLHDLIRTPAFRTLLTSLTSLLCIGYTSHVRRFRPGLDYTLARGEPSDGEVKLDVGLGLTPKPRSSRDEEMWEEGECGGWEMWLATEEGGDEATYGDGGKSKTGTPAVEGDGEGKKEGDADGAEEEEEEDDGPLLALRPGWNELSLTLRDAGVLKFVKYLSAKAPGSRWDVGGEWEVRMVEEEDDDGDKAQ
ncbi:Oxoglutarate and iron-dependent oxygenase degradation C-term-domain-containing protein [Leucosporidium creatinivorum]|uniref:uS12 prolyl 3,4-dihydroxylase n=1 Tax=Leucosporidium creatinivorum TaxID=106004 RepID=A0A1Y2F166_9BASI|nr:Oxoglutarate and iron-dependent oxygenase degradation C-term-domain-containing protein [Leucosporidium creatinivorum]